jgi:hypothetical protein
LTLKFYIKKEEDSLYFEHFFKVVYNKARKIGGLWIKLRKLKKYLLFIKAQIYDTMKGMIQEIRAGMLWK